MRFTTSQLRAVHDALHRLVGRGEEGDTDHTEADALVAYEKVCSEIRKRARRSITTNPNP